MLLPLITLSPRYFLLRRLPLFTLAVIFHAIATLLPIDVATMPLLMPLRRFSPLFSFSLLIFHIARSYRFSLRSPRYC